MVPLIDTKTMDNSESSAIDHSTMKERRYLNRSSWHDVWKSTGLLIHKLELLLLLPFTEGDSDNDTMDGEDVFVAGDGDGGDVDEDEDVMRLVRLFKFRLMEVESQKEPSVMDRAISLKNIKLSDYQLSIL